MKDLRISITYTPDHSDEAETITIEKDYVENDVAGVQRLLDELTRRMHIDRISIDPNQTTLDL